MRVFPCLAVAVLSAGCLFSDPAEIGVVNESGVGVSGSLQMVFVVAGREDFNETKSFEMEVGGTLELFDDGGLANEVGTLRFTLAMANGTVAHHALEAWQPYHHGPNRIHAYLQPGRIAWSAGFAD